MATLSFSAISTAVTAVVAILAFIIGGLVRPYTRKRHLAEELAIQTARKDQEQKERIDRLLRISEVHERRLDRLEKAMWKVPEP